MKQLREAPNHRLILLGNTLTVRTFVHFQPHYVMYLHLPAYFERSVDSLFEVIHRPEFEHHLRSHLSNRLYDDDPAWLALRNTVYASGCRLYRSQNHSDSFVSIQQEAWHFFSNALSVHSDLLLRSPSIRAVRALLAMVRLVARLAHEPP